MPGEEIRCAGGAPRKIGMARASCWLAVRTWRRGVRGHRKRQEHVVCFPTLCLVPDNFKREGGPLRAPPPWTTGLHPCSTPFHFRFGTCGLLFGPGGGWYNWSATVTFVYLLCWVDCVGLLPSG